MIGFAAPWALAGLCAAAVPLLLHLFARRDPPTVDFPAVRYLGDTTRSDQRRLHLQHWVLLLVRTLLVVALVLAAAGPSWAGGGGSHAPAALALVVDNSLSSAAIVAGQPLIEQLRRAASGVLARASADDALWLVTADGIVAGRTPAALETMVGNLAPSPRRLDLGATVGLAREVLATDARPGEVIVLTDLQASALGPMAGAGPVLVARPEGPVPANAGVSSVATGSQPWAADGGQVTVTVASADSASVPLSVSVPGRPPRQSLAAAGRPATVPVGATGAGWVPLSVELAPDELRLDDRWNVAVRVAPPARVQWDRADRYLGTAAAVLEEGGRIVSGTAIRLGGLGSGASVVVPPADPADVGALNRALAARGLSWSYGPRVTAPGTTDSGTAIGVHAVSRRHALLHRGGTPAGVLATVAGEPWLVRAGDVVLLGSRLDPDWTALPLSAEFLPFLDGLLNRVVQGQLAMISATPGDPVPLPDQTDAVATPAGTVSVEGGAPWRPQAPGLHFLLADGDTIGVVSVNPDPRESLLVRADDASLRALWPGVRIVPLAGAAGAAFRSVARSDLRGPLLWLALLLGVVEMGLAGWRRRPR